jgi:hypothetical protein
LVGSAFAAASSFPQLSQKRTASLFRAPHEPHFMPITPG